MNIFLILFVVLLPSILALTCDVWKAKTEDGNDKVIVQNSQGTCEGKEFCKRTAVDLPGKKKYRKIRKS